MIEMETLISTKRYMQGASAAYESTLLNGGYDPLGLSTLNLNLNVTFSNSSGKMLAIASSKPSLVLNPNNVTVLTIALLVAPNKYGFTLLPPLTASFPLTVFAEYTLFTDGKESNIIAQQRVQYTFLRNNAYKSVIPTT